VYTIAIIFLQSVLNISFHYTIILITIITIVYSYMGGMTVVWGDAIQGDTFGVCLSVFILDGIY
jgi:Na+/proline symporter